MHQVESDFIYKDFRCVVVAGDVGHRCGYVAIPETHKLYGIEYDKPYLPYKDLENEEIGDRGIFPMICHKQGELAAPDLYFDVHGSITYSEFGSGLNRKNEITHYPIETKEKLWWFGFDCMHYDDSPDPTLQSKPSYFNTNGKIWYKEDVEQELRRFVEQLCLI